MGRDPLRQLEDWEVSLEQAIKDGKIVTSIITFLRLLNVVINHEKRLVELEKNS